jgi:hypothetical protein
MPIGLLRETAVRENHTGRKKSRRAIGMSIAYGLGYFVGYYGEALLGATAFCLVAGAASFHFLRGHRAIWLGGLAVCWLIGFMLMKT